MVQAIYYPYFVFAEVEEDEVRENLDELHLFEIGFV